MGKALHQALGEKAGIKRFGFASAPLDETLAQSHHRSQRQAIPRVQRQFAGPQIKAFDLGLFEDFFQAFVTQAG